MGEPINLIDNLKKVLNQAWKKIQEVSPVPEITGARMVEENDTPSQKDEHSL